MPNDTIKNFLHKISQLESSSGQNTEHPIATKGVSAGDQAIGQYGLMPNTIKELANRRRLQGTSTPEFHNLSNMDSKAMKEYIEQNPELENELASQLAGKVMENQQGDEDRAAYSWQMGHNLTPDRIPAEKLDTSPYVQKYRKLKDMMNEEE